MDRDDLAARAEAAFGVDPAAVPPMTLQGGDAVDSYAEPPAHDPALDQPSDAYLEAHAFFALPHLDARPGGTTCRGSSAMRCAVSTAPGAW